jgi:ADP-heptose:LPS heptosyltransferase
VAYDRTRDLTLQRLRNALPWYRPFNTIVEIDAAVHRAVKYQRLVRDALGWTLAVDWPLEPPRPVDEPLRLFVHPHASKASKAWPIDRFATVLSNLAAGLPLWCFVNEGHARECGAAAALASALRASGVQVTAVAFDPSCVGLRDALRQVHAAVGLDSGPMQLAGLLGVPTLVIYGPYQPAEVSPLWRTMAVTPPGGQGPAAAVSIEKVSEALARFVNDIRHRRNGVS